MPSPSLRVAWSFVRVLSAIALATGAAGAQKTDSVWIRNGDRITGEVKSLARGLLKYSTDDLGTISIEWDKVDRISSTTLVQTTLRSGDKFFGRLRLGPRRTVILGADTVPLLEIVALTPIERKVRDRLNGYLDLGFSLQQAEHSSQLTTGARVAYRVPKTETSLELKSFLEDRADGGATSRLSTAFTERLLLPRRWSTGAILGYEMNDELDLAGRGTIVGFVGRTFVQTNRVELGTTAGMVLATERYFSADTTARSVEGMAGAVFRAFRYDWPKLDAGVTLRIYPSFSVPGRVRLQNDMRLSYEVVKDFMLTVSVFHAFDSQPQSANAPRNDFGTTLAVSWTY